MDENMTKAITLRSPELNDLPVVIDIIEKIGVEKIIELFNPEVAADIVNSMSEKIGDENNKVAAATVGIQIGLKIFNLIIKNYKVCESDVHQLLSQLTGLTVQEVGRLPLKTAWKLIKVLTKGEEFKDFFMEAVESAE